ncbi:MAG: hypothetical protein LUO96_03430 [Methanomicrobiales archaeon]|nr:hypothetical protein [Methanomicrobiales archaeon]
MTRGRRTLPVERGEVRCLPGEPVIVEKCRFCVHSTSFRIKTAWITSPARAYCLRSRPEKDVDLSTVEEVECDDLDGEGYRSIMSILS